MSETALQNLQYQNERLRAENEKLKAENRELVERNNQLAEYAAKRGKELERELNARPKPKWMNA